VTLTLGSTPRLRLKASPALQRGRLVLPRKEPSRVWPTGPFEEGDGRGIVEAGFEEGGGAEFGDEEVGEVDVF